MVQGWVTVTWRNGGGGVVGLVEFNVVGERDVVGQLQLAGRSGCSVGSDCGLPESFLATWVADTGGMIH